MRDGREGQKRNGGLEGDRNKGSPELACRADHQSVLRTDEKRDGESGRIAMALGRILRAGYLGADV